MGKALKSTTILMKRVYYDDLPFKAVFEGVTGMLMTSKDGKKIMTKIILPGQTIFIGGYVLTFQLGDAPAAGKKKGGMLSGLFGGKKKK